MSEPVRLYAKDGTQFDCAAPSEVVRLLASGDWRREPWPVAPTVAPKVAPPAQDDDADEIPFATPLPKAKSPQTRKARKGSDNGVL